MDQGVASTCGVLYAAAKRVLLLLLLGIGFAQIATAQVTPADNYPPLPDDTPTVRVGGTLFVDYTHSNSPEILDANGVSVEPSSFNVTRAYVNITGQVNHLVAFRVTPDIVRETGTGSSLNGSDTLRLKYGYAQLNLDDWLWRGTYARAGMIQTPYIDFEENVYRYRFQGPTFTDREGYLPSADFGAAVRTQFPGGYGEFYGGLYNGEGFGRADPNDQKALEFRGTLRPLPGPGLIHGLRLTFSYDADHYQKGNDRTRLVDFISYEHRFVNAGFVYLKAADQVNQLAPRVESNGLSIWVTPRILLGQLELLPTAGATRPSLEGLFRFDRLEPDQSSPGVKERLITGVAYWPRMTTSSVSSSILVDYEAVRYLDFAPARPTERRLAVHLLVAF